MVPSGVKRLVLPTRGYRRLRSAADLPSLGLVTCVASPAAPSAAATSQCGEKCGLNSPTAIHASILVVRAFVRMREMLNAHAELARKVDEMEKKYDGQFKIVFDAFRQLMNPPESPRRQIGFHAKPEP